MRYSIQPRDRIYLKRYRFLSFAKNMGKSLTDKDGQNLWDNAKKFSTDAKKTTRKRAIDLIGKKIDNDIKIVSKKI